MNKEGKTRKTEGKKAKEFKKKEKGKSYYQRFFKKTGGTSSVPTGGFGQEPPSVDTWLTRKGSVGLDRKRLPGTRGSPSRVPGGSPESPSRGHVAHPVGFRGA